MHSCVLDVFGIYDNILPSLIMIIIKTIILYFIQIRHTDDFPSTGTRLVHNNLCIHMFKMYSHLTQGVNMRGIQHVFTCVSSGMCHNNCSRVPTEKLTIVVSFYIGDDVKMSCIKSKY